jgi:hypothetical protein
MRNAFRAIPATLGVLAFASTAHAYTFKTIHSFCAETKCTDGEVPTGPLAMDAQGNLFGLTFEGGNRHLAGTVFGLFRTPGTEGWTYSVLYRFCHGGCKDGDMPTGGLVADVSGNLYGVTTEGGDGGGTIFELSPPVSEGTWTFHRLHTFCGENICTDGKLPFAGLTYAGAASGALYDGVSPLYGTTEEGGMTSTGGVNAGVVYQLAMVRGKLHESVIYTFGSQSGDGILPVAPVIVDGDGNLFGTTSGGGAFADIHGHGGTVFELTHGSGGTWTENILYSFNALPNGADGYSPQAPVLMDESGNLIGTTANGGTSQPGGTAFRLTPGSPTWQETVLNNFCVETRCADGQMPNTGLTINSSGALIGTTFFGGTNPGFLNEGAGTIFQLNGTFQIIYDFCSEHHCIDGEFPNSTLVMDGAGNLFGTTTAGGKHRRNSGAGTIFELSP